MVRGEAFTTYTVVWLGGWVVGWLDGWLGGLVGGWLGGWIVGELESNAKHSFQLSCS